MINSLLFSSEVYNNRGCDLQYFINENSLSFVKDLEKTKENKTA